MGDEQTAATVAERRKHPRVRTENEVSYILFDANEQILDQGKGKTLNLSQSGALLKTEKPLDGSFIVLITLNLEGKKIKVRGRVANTRQSERLRVFLTGIEFTGSEKEQKDAIVALVKLYHHRKKRGKKSLYSVRQTG